MSYTLPIPTAEIDPFGDKRVTIHLFGKPNTWRLDQGDSAEQIARFAQSRGVSKIFSPRTNFTSRICTEDDLSDRKSYQMPRCDKLLICRTPEKDFGDGVEATPKTAYYLPSGDCPTVVLYDSIDNRVVAFHAGRECLWDKARVIGDGKPREYESIVGAALARFFQESRHRLQAFVTCGISGRSFTHPFDHPQYGKQNEKMVHYLLGNVGLGGLIHPDGRLPIKLIIERQLVMGGLDPEAIGRDGFDTYSSLNPETGEPAWNSNRRGDKDGRNGVLIIHH